MPSQLSEIKHLPAGAGPAYWGPGNQVRFLITGAESNGALFMGEATVPPGGGPPPHIHQREDESFYLLEGTLTVQIGERIVEALPGDVVHLPRGIAHSFRNAGTDLVKFIFTTVPAGLEGYFAEAFEPAADDSGMVPPPSPQLIERVRTLAPKYGLLLLPPASSR